jgi:hypothetical protein
MGYRELSLMEDNKSILDARINAIIAARASETILEYWHSMRACQPTMGKKCISMQQLCDASVSAA